MLYLWLKFIHVVSSTILFGTGIGTACVLLFAYRTKDVRVIAAATRYVVLADWIFTATSGVMQPLTGFWMAHLAGYSLTSFWMMGSIVGYIIAGCSWLPVVFLQIKMRDLAQFANKFNTPLPRHFYRYFRYWFILGWPAFISLIIVFYLMTNKPI